MSTQPNDAEGTTPPTKPEKMPAFWWLEPWTFAIQQWNGRDRWYRIAQLVERERDSSDQLMAKYCVALQDAKAEKAAAVEALGKHARNYGPLIGPDGVDLPACITTLVRNYDELNKWNDEFCAERNKAWHDLITTKAELDAIKSGEEQALQHANEQLAQAKAALDTMGKRLDEVREDRAEAERLAVEEGKACDLLRDELADVKAKLNREQIDHTATLGYVLKVEAKLKRAKAKLKAKKKGGAK